MKQLYLIRHARAKRDREEDSLRPLRRRGQRQAEAMAAPLWRLGAFDGELHVSGARRAIQTLHAMDAALPDAALARRAGYHDALYAVDGKALKRWLRQAAPEIDRLTLIGHNPALLALAQWLCPRAPTRLPTAGLVHIALPIRRWRDLARHRGELIQTLSPGEASYALFAPPKPPRLEDLPLHRRLRRQLAYQYRLIRALEPGVLAGQDPEFLHQYRVNLRRSRALAETVLSFAKLPRLARALQGLKRCARASGELRDLDVFLETLTSPPPEAGDAAAPLATWLETRAREARQALNKRLRSRRYARAMRAWRRAIGAGSLRQALVRLPEARLTRVLEARLAGHDAQLASLDAASPDAEFHALRKRVKRIRYLAELAPSPHHALLAGLKQRQTLLGDFQDLCTQRDWLRAFADAPSGRALSTPARRALVEWRTLMETRHTALRREILALAPLRR